MRERHARALLAAWLVAAAAGAAAEPGRDAVCLNGYWQVVAAQGPVSENRPPLSPATAWCRMLVPGKFRNHANYEWDYEVWGPDGRPANGKLSKAFFRTTFFVPAEWKGSRVALEFGAVDHYAKVFVNPAGKNDVVGEHYGNNTPFEIDVTGRVRFGAGNTLLVYVESWLSRCFNDANLDGDGNYATGANNVDLQSGHDYTIKAHVWYFPPNWFSSVPFGNFSEDLTGITGDVHLKRTPPVHVERALVFTEVDPRARRMRTVVHVANASSAPVALRLSQRVLDGKQVAFDGLPGRDLRVPAKSSLQSAISTDQWRDAVLWGIGGQWGPPMRYTLEATLTDPATGRVVDRVYERFGFCQLRRGSEAFREDPRMLYLNNRLIYLRGDVVGGVQSHGMLSRQHNTIYADASRRTTNINYWRTHGSGFYDSLEHVGSELGMLVEPQFFVGDGPFVCGMCLHPHLRDQAKALMRRRLEESINRPAVAIYSIDNEAATWDIPAVQAMQRELGTFVKAVDPTRLITHQHYGCLGLRGQPEGDYLDIFNYHCYNDYTDPGNQTGLPFQSALYGYNPKKPLMVGEICVEPGQSMKTPSFYDALLQPHRWVHSDDPGVDNKPVRHAPLYQGDWPPNDSYDTVRFLADWWWQRIADTAPGRSGLSLAGVSLLDLHSYAWMGPDDYGHPERFRRGPWDYPVADGAGVGRFGRARVPWPAVSGPDPKPEFVLKGGFYAPINWFDPDAPQYYTNLLNDRMRQVFREHTPPVGEDAPAFEAERVPEFIITLRAGEAASALGAHAQGKAAVGWPVACDPIDGQPVERRSVATDDDGRAWFVVPWTGRYRVSARAEAGGKTYAASAIITARSTALSPGNGYGPGQTNPNSRGGYAHVAGIRQHGQTFEPVEGYILTLKELRARIPGGAFTLPVPEVE